MNPIEKLVQDASGIACSERTVWHKCRAYNMLINDFAAEWEAKEVSYRLQHMDGWNRYEQWASPGNTHWDGRTTILVPRAPKPGLREAAKRLLVHQWHDAEARVTVRAQDLDDLAAALEADDEEA